MDLIQIINSVIVDLDAVTVKGAENMSLILNSIQKLDAVRKALATAKADTEAQNVQNPTD